MADFLSGSKRMKAKRDDGQSALLLSQEGDDQVVERQTRGWLYIYYCLGTAFTLSLYQMAQFFRSPL